MTNQTIVTTIQKYLDDIEGADANTTSVLTAVKFAVIELSGMSIIKEKLFPQTSTAISLIEGQTEYSLPSNYNYNLAQVIYDSAAAVGAQRELLQTNYNDMFKHWESLGASIENFSLRGTNLVIAGTPSSAETGKVLKIHYSEMPDVDLIMNDNTETILGKKYPHVLVDMAIRRFLLTEPDLAPVADRYDRFVERHKEDIRQELETVTSQGEFEMEY